ncbi:pterin-4-alpha-carbinolamine dehydratase [Solemya pervernicosa gill symbiont]|uniref:Putative pterin-4-alpha-carbinolamine dehydratase n=2 Tax=Gammaproteobacteria incertae sedis TaxID=118884 RepID=A0A1T2L549_9GAMM|nr:4a-hydroxytetrahydrobiopterin dehydratase [Candidatus Reidiella endopervernicosa]OOZ40209.1 pterin-4-alpha-carbinolamine dehydratase [Solemya pervernicosa gill symbiont]QKQ27135.1 4a-hydroxytetrahydrobiopterin dehydratase [Candidatus Reidiella endopervernicosa]
MSTLLQRHCQSLSSDTPPLDEELISRLQQEIDTEWQLDESLKQISRTLRFKNYYQTIAFVNGVAWIAHQQDHHPDLEVSYNRCLIHFSTHSVGGLSENDFICAAQIDALFNGGDNNV